MVCPRCIEAIKTSLGAAKIGFEKVELGEVILKKPLNNHQRNHFESLIADQGFEILEGEASSIVSSIKGLIIEQIHYSDEPLKTNFSTFLAEKLSKDYSTLSRLFSSVESITIEKFVTAQKIERVKELLVYNEMTLSQIAHLMNYSSVAHLSAQFKKETGLTPTSFKNQRRPARKSLDQV